MNAWQYHYHYTDKKGLEGILRDKYLRATFITRTNDKSEFIHGVKLIERSLRKKKIKEECIQRFLNCYVNGLVNQTGVFLTCFSSTYDEYVSKNGLLSQWSRYGNYAIKFRDPLSRTKKVFEGSGGWIRTFTYYFKRNGIGKVGIYDINFESEFAKELKNIEKYVTKFFTEWPLIKIPSNYQHNKVLNNFLKCCYTSKHYGFLEENEIRIVVTLDNGNTNHFYSGDGRTYIKIFEKDDITKDIEEIIIGPVVNKKREATEIRGMLKKYGVEAKVRISATPLKK
jgi:hypothetical protein